MTLHEAIAFVLNENRTGMSAVEIATIINERGLYIRGDRQPVPTSQIYARINTHAKWFKLKDGVIQLTLSNKDVYQNKIWDLLNSVRDIRALNSESLIPFLFFFAHQSQQHSQYFVRHNFDTLIKLRGQEQRDYLWAAAHALNEHPDFQLDEYLISSISQIEREEFQSFSEIIFRVHELHEQIRSDEFAEFFNELIIAFSGLQGSYATSRELSEYVSSLVKVEIDDSICDPFAGSATLISLVLKGQAGSGPYHLFDIFSLAVLLGKLNVISSGIPNVRYQVLNTIYYPPSVGLKYDWVITEPPIGLRFSQADYDGFPFLRFPAGYRGENVIIQLVLDLMKEQGKAVILVAEGFLFSTDVNTIRLREYIIKNDWVEAVHSLPVGVNPRSKIKLSLLILNKAKSVERKNKIFFKKVSKNEVATQGQGGEELVVEESKSIGLTSIYKSKEDVLSNQSLLNANRYLIPEIDAKGHRRLGDLVDFRTGANIIDSNLESKGAVPYIRVKDLINKADKFNLDISTIDTFVEAELVRPTSIIKGPCVLVAKAGKDLKATYVKEVNAFAINGSIVALLSKSTDIILDFLTIQLHQSYIDLQLEQIRGGATTPFVRLEDLMNLKVWCPSLPQQQSFLVDFYQTAPKVRDSNDKLLSTLKHEFSNLKEAIDTDHELLRTYLDRKHQSSQHFSWNDPISEMQGSRTVTSVFNNVRSVASDMGNLLHDIQLLLNLSNRKLKRRTIDIYSLVREQKQQLGHIVNDVQFHFFGDEAKLNIDPQLFQYVIRNFIINSVKHGFSRIDKVKFLAFDLEPSEDGLSADFVMMNNGADWPDGFSREDFISFGGKSGETGGSGIGGFLMNEIAELHQGRLDIPKEFYERGLFWFPLKVNEVTDEVEDSFTFIPTVVIKITLSIE